MTRDRWAWFFGLTDRLAWSSPRLTTNNSTLEMVGFIQKPETVEMLSEHYERLLPARGCGGRRAKRARSVLAPATVRQVILVPSSGSRSTDLMPILSHKQSETTSPRSGFTWIVRMLRLRA